MPGAPEIIRTRWIVVPAVREYVRTRFRVLPWDAGVSRCLGLGQLGRRRRNMEVPELVIVVSPGPADARLPASNGGFRAGKRSRE